MLGDSAFREKSSENSRKTNDAQQMVCNLPTRPRGPLTRARMSAEWGVCSLKNVWRIFNRKFPSDDDHLNQMIGLATMKLHNYRVRLMRVGQMSTIFMPNDHDYSW